MLLNLGAGIRLSNGTNFRISRSILRVRVLVVEKGRGCLGNEVALVI